jgi:hypothetical protein
VFDAVGECSMGEVNVRIEPNVTFQELHHGTPVSPPASWMSCLHRPQRRAPNEHK